MSNLSPLKTRVFAPLSALCLLAAGAFATHQDTAKYSYAYVTKNGSMTVGNWDSSFNDLQKTKGPDRLYVRKDGATYIITDSATLARTKKAIEPMVKLGEKQSALGEQQSKLGEAQSKLGEKQGKLGEEMGRLGEQLGALAEKQAGRENSSDQFEAKQQEIQNKMEALQKQMDVLNKQMSGPSSKQEELGRKQEALGKLQEKASAKAEKEITTIIDSAFAHNLAKRV